MTTSSPTRPSTILSNWGAPLGARRGRGVSIQHAFGSFLATVAEVEVDETGNVRVDRFVSAVDCGVIVNPNGVIAQMAGGLIFGMTAALFGEIGRESCRERVCQYV